MNQDQYEFLNDRIDHSYTEIDNVSARVTILESAKEVKKAHTLEWIVIVLILIEILEGIPLWHYLHG